MSLNEHILTERQHTWGGFCRFLTWSTGAIILLLVVLALTLL